MNKNVIIITTKNDEVIAGRYVDENENEVEEELATHLILKKYVDGKEVSSEKYPVNKDREMSI